MTDNVNAHSDFDRIYNDAVQADNDWQSQLARTYGAIVACDARYDSRGYATPGLASLRTRMHIARYRWLDAMADASKENMNTNTKENEASK